MEHNRWEPSRRKYARSTNPIRQVRKILWKKLLTPVFIHLFIHYAIGAYTKNDNFLR